MMDIDVFRGVAPFVAVAEELSFRKAAVRLGVTPAAVSKSIQTLEAELGVKLLERTSRVVTVTREGASFFQSCRSAVAAVSGARAEAAASRRAPQGEAGVSAPFILSPLVVDALAQLRHRHPRLTVRLHVTDQIAKLAAERIDVAVRIGAADDTLVARLLRRTRWVTVASPAYLARRPAPETVGALDAHDCLVFVAPNGRPRAWTFRSGEGSLRGALHADHGPSLRKAALAGMGIAQLLDFMVQDDLADGRLTSVLDHESAEGPPLRALCLPGRQSASVKAIFAQLAQTFAAG